MTEFDQALMNSLLGKSGLVTSQPNPNQIPSFNPELPLYLKASPLLKDIALAHHDQNYMRGVSFEYKGDQVLKSGTVSHNFRVTASHNTESYNQHSYDVCLLEKDGKFTYTRTKFFSFEIGHKDDFGNIEQGSSTSIHKRDPEKMVYKEVDNITADELSRKVDAKAVNAEVSVGVPLTGQVNAQAIIR